MQRSPMESMAFFVSGQVVDIVEDRAEGESQLDEASQGSTVAEDGSATEQSFEERENGEVDLVHEDEGTEDDAASTASSASSVERSSRASDATASTSSSHAAEAGRPMAHLSCRLCSEDGSAPEEPLFRCPCRCPDTFVHRSCLEQLLYQGPEGAVCPVCDAHYPVRRRTKPLWLWFWDEESREDATLFLANMVFSLGNIGVLTMAWMYVLFEYRTKSWLPTASLASALFVLSVLWVAFGCLRFHVLFMSLVRWRRANTTLKVLLTDKTVAQA
uniref:E3 ubiquitin protein ligase MARCH3 n=1 Tax=Rhipicephalus appendiculatus TaxID=34631 RepID=A0A131YJ68_RHIAP